MQGSTDRAEMIGRRVGRYTVVKHLASGGMAELYIARQQAVGGFEKQLVLKLLQGRFADNARVVEMFLDEARLAAKLNHPSIVHVYDVAEDDGVKFIAMEHIHGETLTDIIRRGVAVNNYLPLEHSVHIASQTAAGLAYAHGRFDAGGAPLRIVHRDVSPSNILVSYEGQTKIVDFGIARIQDQLREESGMLPGKASYMSPEQVAGEGADYRSDIFSLGIILYEISLGQRLYRGPPDEVMRRIVEEKIAPPTSVRRNYPPALELSSCARWKSAPRIAISRPKRCGTTWRSSSTSPVSAPVHAVWPATCASCSPPRRRSASSASLRPASSAKRETETETRARPRWRPIIRKS